jgi:hypothetical protein
MSETISERSLVRGRFSSPLDEAVGMALLPDRTPEISLVTEADGRMPVTSETIFERSLVRGRSSSPLDEAVGVTLLPGTTSEI